MQISRVMPGSAILSRVNLPTRIYQLLKRRIVANRLPFGMKLVEEKIAKELGVSRTPVREAFNRLVQDGILVASPGRGAFVASFSLEDTVELLEVREALEGIAARLAADRMTRDHLRSLRARLAAGMIQRRRNGYTGYVKADREFHEAIISACGNRHLTQLMFALRERIQMLRHRSVILPGRARKSFREHLAVIDALSRKEPELAEERMRAHIRNVRADLVATLGAFTEIRNKTAFPQESRGKNAS